MFIIEADSIQFFVIIIFERMVTGAAYEFQEYREFVAINVAHTNTFFLFCFNFPCLICG